MDESLKLATPPDWSLWIGDCGRYAIFLAAALFVGSVVAWLLAPRFSALKRVAGPALNLGVVSLFASFVCLGALFVGSRFEYAYVFEHGDLDNALQYRIAGIWSGQQGSFLLWACASGLFALLTVRGTGPLRRWYSVAYGTFLAALAGILAFESPFVLNMVDGKPVVPPNGAGLAPSLQNYWVVIHPPTIFLGFGALTVLFAYAFAAMAERDFTGWLPRVRPWALVSLAVLGLGLCMGGFWAYETLGWGGFWMWDPVENVSFVPWCLTAAFIHGIVVQTARGTKKVANLLLAGLPFLCFIYGTFLTRSGFLSDASVHSFAEMDRSALRLLMGLMGISFVGFLGLFGYRALQMRGEDVKVENKAAEPSSPYGRESLINIGIATISAIGVATLIGMSIPFVQALKHQPSKVVEEGLYHQVLTWFFIPTILLMAVAPFTPWRNATAKDLISRFYSILCLSVGFTGLFLICLVFTPFGKVVDHSPVVTLLGIHKLPGLAWIMFLVGSCSFAVIGNAWRIWELRKKSRLGWAPFLAHIGVAILMFGLIVSRGFEQKGEVVVMKDHPGKALGYEFRYRSMTSNDKDKNNRVLFDVYDANDPKNLLFTANPGMYKVPSDDGENTMVWPSIVHRPLYDVYVSLRPPQNEVSDPMQLKEGETKVLGGLVVKYDKLSTNGMFGQPGAAFTANLTIDNDGVKQTVHPSIELGPSGKPVYHAVAVDGSMDVQLASMNAADRSVTLQFQLSTPMFPIDVFHKPMTGFVWLGTGLMTVAGLLAAAYRRVPSTSKAAEKVPVPTGGRNRRLAKQNS